MLDFFSLLSKRAEGEGSPLNLGVGPPWCSRRFSPSVPEGELSAVLTALSAVLTAGLPAERGRAAAGEGGGRNGGTPKSSWIVTESLQILSLMPGDGIKTKRKLATETVTGSFAKPSSEKKVYF